MYVYWLVFKIWFIFLFIFVVIEINVLQFELNWLRNGFFVSKLYRSL